MIKWSLFVGLTWVIQYGCLVLIRMFKIAQPIYELSPQSHQNKKLTPSFGGVAILLSLCLGTIIINAVSINTLWVVSLTITFGMIGFIDDYLSLVTNKNQGLTSRKKLAMQTCAALFFLIALHWSTQPLEWWHVVPLWFIIVGSSNATNLTDGLDGLLGGVSVITALGFWIYFTAVGADELRSLSLIIAVCMGIFLLFNHHPAKIFMGDTGSLALGAGFAGLAIVSQNIWILIPLGAVYIMETISVILQVAYFRLTRKRIFLMAPLHHHFELMGISETKVVGLFYTIGLGFLGLFYLLYVHPIR